MTYLNQEVHSSTNIKGFPQRIVQCLSNLKKGKIPCSMVGVEPATSRFTIQH